MTKKPSTPLATALGAAFVTSLGTAGAVGAADNPFALTELGSGYQVAHQAEGKCGAASKSGKAVQKETGEGKCGTGGKGKEGTCGAMPAGQTAPEGQKMPEGKCGTPKQIQEGKCGAHR